MRVGGRGVASRVKPRIHGRLIGVARGPGRAARCAARGPVWCGWLGSGGGGMGLAGRQGPVQQDGQDGPGRGGADRDQGDLPGRHSCARHRLRRPHRLAPIKWRARAHARPRPDDHAGGQGRRPGPAGLAEAASGYGQLRPDVLAQQLVFGSATSYTAVSPGAQIVKFTAPGEHTGLPVTLAAGSVHTIVVLDDSSGLKVDTVTDAAGSQIMPKGAASAGFGGTAPRPPADLAPWLAVIAAGALLATAGLVRLRRPA